MHCVLARDAAVLNVDEDASRERLLTDGWRELTAQERTAAGMDGLEHLVSPANTVVSPDGGIVFTPPPAPSQEALFTGLRAQRDSRIAATDYLLMPDYPISPERLAVVKTYRQALRDLPGQSGAPWDGGGEQTPWPVLPGAGG